MIDSLITIEKIHYVNSSGRFCIRNRFANKKTAHFIVIVSVFSCVSFEVIEETLCRRKDKITLSHLHTKENFVKYGD